jgi:hypothetical protein
MSLNNSKKSGSSSSTRSELREKAGEAYYNLLFVQHEAMYAYQIGECADRQEILERWVKSQRTLVLTEYALRRFSFEDPYFNNAPREWYVGYNSPSSPGLDSILEDRDCESLSQFSSNIVKVPTKNVLCKDQTNSTK